MGRNYLEVIFRRWVLLVIPVVVCTAAAAFVGLSQPREFSTTATVWVDSRAPADSTVGDPSASPSAGQLILLNQLLKTPSFMDVVGRTGPYADQYNEAAAQEKIYMQGEIASHISAGAPGPQLLSLTVTGTDPATVLDLADTVLRLYQQEQSDILVERADAQAQYNRQQLESAQAALANAAPGTEAFESAFNRVAEATDKYRSSELLLEALLGAEYRLVGAPDVALPMARMKGFVTTVGGGVAAGVTISLGLLIAFMLLDRSIRSTEEAERLLEMDVAGWLPDARLEASR